MAGGLFGAIEAGGTKINVAVGSSPTDIIASERIETTTPSVSIAAILSFFEQFRDRLQSFGVASFGPVRLNRSDDDWGRLLNTPKPGWSGASFVHPLIEHFGLPVELDTDVNAAGLAEHQLGALRGVPCGVYMTVGTGVGGGLITEGIAIHGALHPEIGHMRILRSASDNDFPGCCPYHGDCLEGLASGPAIKLRWGSSLSQLPLDHVAHGLIADYIGQACATLALTLSAGRIVIGGGVSHSPRFHPAIAERMKHWLGGYLVVPETASDDFIVPPGLGDRAGLMGAMLLANRRP
jgi:fructokinase